MASAAESGDMAEPAVGGRLVDEAVDVTTSEPHARAVSLLRSALSYALRGWALVLADMFVRVEGREQVAPDVFVVTGAEPGRRRVYAVPDEPVPSVTIEVLSPANREPEGLAALEAKRSLFARVGVPLHVEIDPDEGFIAVWENHGGELVRAALCTTYTSEALGGVRIDTPSPGSLRVFLPSGHEVLDGGEELARAERLAARLRALGEDVDE